jgi:DNA-directed RNA polymerase specialized sigma24 family protein
MESEPTDKDLLNQLSTDPAAFETFYWRHLDRVIGFTARRVREPADVVAVTFLTVLTAGSPRSLRRPR